MSDPSEACTMIATLGGQPQVVTFALDELLARGQEIAEVVVICVAARAPRVQAAWGVLAGEFAGDRYQGRPCRLRRVAIRPAAEDRDDIQDEAAAEATWQVMHQLIARLKAEGSRLHLVVTGGPRLLGLLAMSAATLHFDHQDRLWHLYTPRPVREAASGGAILHGGADAGLRLIQVPMAPWGAYFPGLRALTQASSGQVLAAQARWLDGTERARCEAVVKRLTGRQVEVLEAFAGGSSPQEVAERLVVTVKTVDAHKTVILDECRNAWALSDGEWLTYHFLREKFAGYFAARSG